ncbi:hypothetical protein IV203_009587 [Nitzschia inconspicua]|uniref:Uncharacterized protein n=1 Tax=Nitzschia inconspicua TaxID=303405 RepID=A0A9K3KV64_9STRA|nr:hypothetical protein IV203_009587 [Nitzschia inconspicua]
MISSSLSKLVERGYGVNKSTCKGMTCHCLQILSDEVFCTAVAEYQVMFFTKDEVEQKKVVIEWLRNGSAETESFRIPFVIEAYVSHSGRVYTLIADFYQNMELPHFGAVQPDETYYLTPVKLEGFGVADVSHVGNDGREAHHLYFHCYQEGDGAKGSTNVASMIMKTLDKTKMIRTDENGAALGAKYCDG